jgi:hypothetical protein
MGEQVVVLRMPEALTEESLEAILTASSGVASAHTVIVDALAMRRYTGEARARFVRFARSLPPGTRLGVVTGNAMWRIVISAMALAAAREIRVFPDRAAAQAWERSA